LSCLLCVLAMMPVYVLASVSLLAFTAQAAVCTPSATNLCMKVNIYTGESGYYELGGKVGPSPNITVQIGKTYVFDQTDATNWYHPVGFAYYPDGAHGKTWGGAERAEVEGAGELLYKINGKKTTCAAAGATGLDCYEPEFFYPRADWQKKPYKAELTITQAVADASHGGVIYYFCHIHSKMSGRLIIQNANGGAVTRANGTALANPTEQALYAPTSNSGFDTTCGTTGAVAYSKGGSHACAASFLPGTLDTDFEKCVQAIDCQMNRHMLVMGYDSHADPIATFIQQMIPHHVNAVNMARILLKHSMKKVAAVEDLEGILWDIVNQQNYQIHQFRNYLGTHAAYKKVSHQGVALGATSVGRHCAENQSANVSILAAASTSGSAATAVTKCVSSATNLCMKINTYAGESGYYEFAGQVGPSPDITVQIGKTYVFDQRDPTNWYHPVGFAYYPDGAHGHTWGGAERDEVEGAGELLYKINGKKTTCPDAGDTGLDCYEPEYFYPRSEWLAKHYTAELTITQAMADKSHGGVIYYFCHIHSKMSGKIIIQNANGGAVTRANGAALADTKQLALYSTPTNGGVDGTCGTTGANLQHYIGSGAKKCNERFLCGTLDTNFEKCMQAIDCQMKTDMYSQTASDNADQVGIFMEQMIPHHLNAMYMAKILMKSVPAATISKAMDEDGLTNILFSIVNVQGYQVHQFRNHLASAAYLSGRSLGSCYDHTTHAITCNVAKASCSGSHYPPGFVSSRDGCCHCEASCPAANKSSTCKYKDPSAGSCYSMTSHKVTCNAAKTSCASSSDRYYAPGFMSSSSGCCHCKASCPSLSSKCTYYDKKASSSTDKDASAGSCYSMTSHKVTCNVVKASCASSSDRHYAPGFVSTSSGCCHCKASCPSLSSKCTYYDAKASSSSGSSGSGANSSATGAGATPNTADAPTKTVTVVMTLKYIDFDKVQANSTVKTQLVDGIKRAFLSRLPGYTMKELTVELTKGSIVASVKITPKAGSDSAALKNTVKTEKAKLVAASVSNVKAVSGVKEFLVAGKALADIEATATDPVEVTVTKAPTSVASTKAPAVSTVAAAMRTNVIVIASLLTLASF